MKFEFNWPSGFSGENGLTDTGVIGILIAHLRAFSSGEIITENVLNVCGFNKF